MNQKIELLQRRLERELAARREAEAILEQKALELYYSNTALHQLNEGLEVEVQQRTRALSIEQSRLESLIENLDSGVLLEDENRRIVIVNDLFCKLFGIPLSPESLKGADCSQSAEASKELFADPTQFTSRIIELLSKREICLDEILHLADGRVFSRSFIPVFSESKYMGHLWKYADVTISHQSQINLQHSEEKYRGLIENMELGLMEVDKSGIILRAYPRFCGMVGYEESELIGKNALDTFLVPSFLPVFEAQDRERATGKASVYEVQIYNKAGGKIWVLISGAPILDSDNQVVGSLGIHYDITPQKNLQKELEEAKRNAEAAQEAEKQFLANMSHEIRTPLNAIIGMSHLLYDTQPNPEQLEYLDILRNSAEMLRALITDILDLSKIRSGHLELQTKEFDLVGAVRSMVKSAQLRLEDRPVKIVASIDSDFKNLVIGDDLLVHQILSNLLGNAEKFTEKGQISVSLSLVPPNSAGQHMYEIRIADSGIGIPKDKQDIIFKTFRQVDGDIKRKFGGTGLGLAITRQIIEIQGGTIRLESELGKGSTFIVQLPYLDSGKAIVDAQKTEQVFRPFETKGKHLLVVEDNHMNRKYIGALLRKWGIKHTFAHNGREGWQSCSKEQYDLILMDIQMPEMDGYEATIAIRESENLNTNTPIIALTASALVSQKDKAFQAGMNDYLSKPFKPEQLMEKIEAYCGVSTAAERSENEQDSDSFQFHERLDSASLFDLYGGDVDYAMEMFGIFLKNAEQEFSRLSVLLKEDKYSEFARLAHKIKPTLSMVGLPDLEIILQDLEHGAKIDPVDPAHLNQVMRLLESQIPEALSAVESDFEKLKKRAT